MSIAMPPSNAKLAIPKLVLLDRDGVINEDVGTPGVINEQQFVLTPQAGIAIGDLKRAGWQVVVVTNQSCVGKGLLSVEGLADIHKHMRTLLISEDTDAIVDEIYVCTSTKEMEDLRMKPNPGMVTEAILETGLTPDSCALIGDNISDLEAAARAGVPYRIMVSTGYGRSTFGRLPLATQTNAPSPSTEP